MGVTVTKHCIVCNTTDRNFTVTTIQNVYMGTVTINTILPHNSSMILGDNTSNVIVLDENGNLLSQNGKYNPTPKYGIKKDQDDDRVIWSIFERFGIKDD